VLYQRENTVELLTAQITSQNMCACVSKYTCTRHELGTAGCINTPGATCSVFLVHWLYLLEMATETKLQLEIH